MLPAATSWMGRKQKLLPVSPPDARAYILISPVVHGVINGSVAAEGVTWLSVHMINGY